MTQMKSTIIAFQSKNELKPVLEINDNQLDQVVIRFISKDEHITIHEGNDGSLLRTHYWPNKPHSKWDEERVGIAKYLGYEHPEKHGNYVIHSPLTKFENGTGYHLVGRLIKLSELNPRQRYYKNISKTVSARDDSFMLNIHLSTKDNPCNSCLEKVHTVLGDICFTLSKPIDFKKVLRSVN